MIISKQMQSRKFRHPSRFPSYVLRITYYALSVSLVSFTIGLSVYFDASAQDEADPLIESSYLGYDDILHEFRKNGCRSCHPAQWREWERSMHGQAWKDPIYQEAASKIPDREAKCDPCHAPEPILITGIGKMPKLRAEDRKYGVSCLVCHIDAQGGMHGPPASIDAMFHANVTDETYMNPTELCGTCHGQPDVPEHNQLASFRDSPAAKEGKNCATCHMPGLKRLQSNQSYEAIEGRRHTWIGSRSVHMLKQAADMTVAFTDGQAIVRVTNKAGHILPGEALRAIILEAQTTNTDGTVTRHEPVFISASSGEGGSDNRIQPGEIRRFTFELSEGARIEAKLRYRLLPTTPEAEWITMAEADQTSQSNEKGR